MSRLLVLFVALGAVKASAQSAADGSALDRRIRCVTYDPEEVVEVTAVVGVATHIVVEPGEVYLTHAFGDAKGWDFAQKANHFFLKPLAANADSNLTIVTDRRSYHLSLKVTTGPGASGTFELSFRYPESEAKKRREDIRRRRVEEGLGRKGGEANVAYSMSGDLDIAPVNAWDDREFTYFKFPGNRDIPAIYMVDVEGTESIVNRHSTGAASETVVVHKVAARWVLRLGSRALAVWNDAYDAQRRRNVTRTASPQVDRVLWR
jgi:type IV secretion system protein VirB9